MMIKMRTLFYPSGVFRINRFSRYSLHVRSGGSFPSCEPSSSDSPLLNETLMSAHLNPACRGRKIAVGMSGGVDSSVAALILKRQGYDVVGVHMTNWDHEEEAMSEKTACEGQRDAHDAAETCKMLNIPFHRVHFNKEYWTDVFEKFLEGLSMGVTPNPDVLCNRKIKFDIFTQYCRSHLGVDAVATGHYARLGSLNSDDICDDVSKTSQSLNCSLDDGFGRSEPAVAVHDSQIQGDRTQLRKGADTDKDQSYFLCRVPSKAFTDVLFPLGGLCKTKVRALATEAGLGNASRRSSTGICFVGKRRFADFLGQYLRLEKGAFVDIDGNPLGVEHGGQALFTLGQRARVSGMLMPMFVCSKDARRNTVTVVPGREHAALYCRYMDVHDMMWTPSPPSEFASGAVASFECDVVVRYRGQPVRCRVEKIPRSAPGSYRVYFLKEFPRAVTSGQVAALYDGDRCLGGAEIRRPGPSFYRTQEPLPHSDLLIG